MNIIEKLKEIASIQKANTADKNENFNNPALHPEMLQIEALIEDSLPQQFKALYAFANGQNNCGQDIFFGDKFMSTGEIINQLKESRTFLKPAIRKVEQPEKSEELIKKIVAVYLANAPRPKFFGLKPAWFKMEFGCSVNAYSGPYLYESESTGRGKHKILELSADDYQKLEPLVRELYILEEQSFNWDELNFTLYQNGKYEVSRDDYDSLYDESFYSSTPENAIKKKYFHYKWVPVFSDYCSNYIGIDMDPDIKGTKGQVIIFGRDEEDMIVLADSLDEFFDFILAHIQIPESNLLHLKFHIHDTLRKLKRAKE